MLPNRTSRDIEIISASWINRVIDCLEYAMNTPAGDGKTILRSGAVLHALPQTLRPPGGGESSGTSAFLAKITGRPVGGLYPVDIYDGIDGEVIGSGYAKPAMLRFNEVLPTDTWITVFESTVNSLTWE